jgi:hypothetical protein
LVGQDQLEVDEEVKLEGLGHKTPDNYYGDRQAKS